MRSIPIPEHRPSAERSFCKKTRNLKRSFHNFYDICHKISNTMRVEIVAYMIYLEGPENPKYVMQFLPKVFWDPQIWEYVRQFTPSWFCPTNNRKLPEIFGLSTRMEYVMQICLHNIFHSILQVIISNGMVPSWQVDPPSAPSVAIFLRLRL